MKIFNFILYKLAVYNTLSIPGVVKSCKYKTSPSDTTPSLIIFTNFSHCFNEKILRTMGATNKIKTISGAAIRIKEATT